MKTPEKREKCPDCGAKIGEQHTPGCDVARCPRCGGQSLSCLCVYRVSGLIGEKEQYLEALFSIETNHPKLYEDGPTDEMMAKFESEWGSLRKPWSGFWPGIEECRELGLWCRDECSTGNGFVPCDENDPKAHEDLNRLYTITRWDPELQQRVLKNLA